MKNIIKSFAALAVSLLAFNACQNELNPEASSTTHSLKFVAESPVTKTSADLENVDSEGYFDYNWSDTDKTRFSVYEIVGDNYVAATSVTADLVDGAMVLDAKFNGAATPGSKYFALLNTGVKSSQDATDTSYDQASDVLISEVVTSENIDNETLLLSFKRENAFALMTAKSLNEGAFVRGASITATNDKLLAAEYDYEAKSFAAEGSNSIVLDVLSEIQGGEATIFVSTLPVEGAALSVGVVTVDNEENFVAAYEKSFKAGSTINFTRGDVRPFNIGMNKVTSLTLDLTTDQTTTASADALTWDKTFVSVISAKVGSGTNANNYYPGTAGKSYTSTRFYVGNTLTFTPKLGVPIKEIVYTATTDAYANAFQSSQWSNATASVSGNVVTVIPTESNNAISVTIGANTGAESIVIRYGIPVPPTTHTVNIDPAIANGTVTAEPFANVLPGTEITLTADPDDGYEFGTWNVTNAETEEEIAVSNNKFTMPDADVNVSATFEKVGTTIVTTMSAANDADIKFVTGSSSAANAFWANSTPLTANDITLSGSVTSGTNYSYYDGSVVRFYANNNIIITPSNGATITKVEIVRSTSSSSNSGTINCEALTASSGNTTTNTNVYEGETKSAVTFTNTAQARFTKIIVYSKAGKTLESVTVSGTPTKTAYVAGDSFDPAGLIVTGTYDDNSQETITEGITWSTPAALTTGQTSVSITATVKGVTSEAYEVTGLTVTEPVVLSSIEVSGTPDKTEYEDGDAFETAGLVVNAVYSDEHKETITEGITWNVTPATLTYVEGKESYSVVVTATALEKTSAEFIVNGLTVSAPVVLTSVTLGGELTKTDYSVGETFDRSGLTVTANYSNDTHVDVTSAAEWQINPETLSEAGNSISVTVTASYRDHNDTGEYTVSVTQPASQQFFYESFNTNDGTGGNDNQWSGSIASNDIKSDDSNWTFVQGKGASRCTKFGTGNALGSAETPAISVTTNTAVVKFKAAAWNGNSESTTLSLSATNATIEETSVTLTKGAWGTFYVNLTGITGEVKVKFAGSAGNNRFFLDEVYVYYGEEPEEPSKVLTDLVWEGYTSSYKVGETFSVDGTITAKFDDNSTETLSASDVTVESEPDLTKANTQTSATISYTYEGVKKTATANISVTSQGGGTTDLDIVFKTSSSDGSTTIAANTQVSNVVSSGASYVKAFTSSCDKAYLACKSGVKLGSSSAKGTLEFTIADSYSSKKVTKIVVKSVKYGSDTGTLTLYGGSTSLKSGQTPGQDLEYTFTTPTALSSIKIATSSKRAYISEIIITVEN